MVEERVLGMLGASTAHAFARTSLGRGSMLGASTARAFATTALGRGSRPRLAHPAPLARHERHPRRGPHPTGLQNMKMRSFPLFVALMLIPASASAAEAPLRRLLSLTPVEVRAQLLGEQAGWPVPRGFEVRRSGASITYLTAHELVADPALLEQQAVWRTQGDVPTPSSLRRCDIGVNATESGAAGGAVILAFKNGRLSEAYNVVSKPGRSVSALTGGRPTMALSPFTKRPGGLPLEDGVGFLEHWRRNRLAEGDRLIVDCEVRHYAPPSSNRRSSGLSASDLQGLALLPFAFKLPRINRARNAARLQGAALLGAMQLGAPVSPSPEALASSRRGVRWHPDADGSYGVLTVDMGGAPTRNLSDVRDVALVGVRSGQVAWVSPPGGAGPRERLLCLEADGTLGAPREGCEGWGHYRP